MHRFLTALILLSAGASAHALHSNWGFMQWTDDSWFLDTDIDGMDDNWERQQFGNLARDGSLDSDRDDVLDGDEYDQGLMANLMDTDGDGVPDGVELAQGTDARDPNSFPPDYLATEQVPWAPWPLALFAFAGLALIGMRRTLTGGAAR